MLKRFTEKLNPFKSKSRSGESKETLEEFFEFAKPSSRSEYESEVDWLEDRKSKQIKNSEWGSLGWINNKKEGEAKYEHLPNELLWQILLFSQPIETFNLFCALHIEEVRSEIFCNPNFWKERANINKIVLETTEAVIWSRSLYATNFFKGARKNSDRCYLFVQRELDKAEIKECKKYRNNEQQGFLLPKQVMIKIMWSLENILLVSDLPVYKNIDNKSELPRYFRARSLFVIELPVTADRCLEWLKHGEMNKMRPLPAQIKLFRRGGREVCLIQEDFTEGTKKKNKKKGEPSFHSVCLPEISTKNSSQNGHKSTFIYLRFAKDTCENNGIKLVSDKKNSSIKKYSLRKLFEKVIYSDLSKIRINFQKNSSFVRESKQFNSLEEAKEFDRNNLTDALSLIVEVNAELFNDKTSELFLVDEEDRIFCSENSHYLKALCREMRDQSITFYCGESSQQFSEETWVGEEAQPLLAINLSAHYRCRHLFEYLNKERELHLKKEDEESRSDNVKKEEEQRTYSLK